MMSIHFKIMYLFLMIVIMQNIWYNKFNCNKQKIPHFRVLEGVIVAIAISLIKKIAQLFISIFLGWFVVKIKLLKSEDSKVISKIALFITVLV